MLKWCQCTSTCLCVSVSLASLSDSLCPFSGSLCLCPYAQLAVGLSSARDFFAGHPLATFGMCRVQPTRYQQAGHSGTVTVKDLVADPVLASWVQNVLPISESQDIGGKRSDSHRGSNDSQLSSATVMFTMSPGPALHGIAAPYVTNTTASVRREEFWVTMPLSARHAEIILCAPAARAVRKTQQILVRRRDVCHSLDTESCFFFEGSAG